MLIFLLFTFYPEGTFSTNNYLVELTGDKGDMNQKVTLQNDTDAIGIGMYSGDGDTDIDGVLEKINFEGATNGIITVQAADSSKGCCQVVNNTVNFTNGNKSCTLEFSGSDIATVDGTKGSAHGKVNYFVATDSGAAGNTYTNKLSYTISSAAI